MNFVLKIRDNQKYLIIFEKVDRLKMNFSLEFI